MKTASKGESRRMAAMAAGCLSLLALPATSVRAGLEGIQAAAAHRHRGSLMILAQADESVTPAQLDKYVSVYRAMQRNHSLTVGQAAAGQGLTLQQFRELEQRVERNSVARNAARRALAKSAAQATPPTAGQKPNPPQH